MMKLSACTIALGLQFSMASEVPKNWSEWFWEGTKQASDGKYPSAIQAFTQGLTLAAASNVDKRQLMDIVSALGAAYASAGEYMEAERQWRLAVSMAQKTYGTYSLDYAVAVANLSILPNEISQDESTLALLRKAIRAYRQTGSPVRLAVVRGHLAEILIAQKKYDEAETLLMDWQTDVVRLKPQDHAQLAALLHYLGGLRYEQGRFVEAVQSYRECVEALDSDVGPEHPALISPVNNLATSLAKVSRLEEASGAFERASSICRKTLGSDHPTCGAILGNYSPVLGKLGHKHEAKAMAEKARQILQASGRRNGLGAIVSVENLRSPGK
jgi:tetratricopeptide (TPR) repeat protein